MFYPFILKAYGMSQLIKLFKMERWEYEMRDHFFSLWRPFQKLYRRIFFKVPLIDMIDKWNVHD